MKVNYFVIILSLLLYSKYKNKDLGEFYNLTFEEWNPDLTSSTTLMLGMQERLKNFIDSEIDYEIDMSINIRRY